MILNPIQKNAIRTNKILLNTNNGIPRRNTKVNNNIKLISYPKPINKRDLVKENISFTPL